MFTIEKEKKVLNQVCKHAESVTLWIEVVDYDVAGSLHYKLTLYNPYSLDEFLGHINGLLDVKVIDQKVDEEKCKFWRKHGFNKGC